MRTSLRKDIGDLKLLPSSILTILQGDDHRSLAHYTPKFLESSIVFQKKLSRHLTIETQALQEEAQADPPSHQRIFQKSTNILEPC